MQLSLTSPARRPSVVLVWIAVLAASAGAIVVIGKSGYEGQMYLVTVAIVGVIAAFVLPKAVARDGKLTLPFVATALESLARVREHQSSYRDADGLYRRALVIQEKARGQSHPPQPVGENPASAQHQGDEGETEKTAA